jgi:hypothetical protein
VLIDPEIQTFNRISLIAVAGARGGTGGMGGPATAAISDHRLVSVSTVAFVKESAESKCLVRSGELILLLRLTLTNTQTCIDRTSVSSSRRSGCHVMTVN